MSEAQAPRSRVRITEAEAQAQLREAMAREGIDMQRVGMPVLDGQRHYVPLVGQRGAEKSAAYRAYYDGSVPAGAIWNHKTGHVVKWKAAGEHVPFSAEQAQNLARDQAARAEQRRQERAAREIAAAQTAVWLIEGTRPASPTHPYLAAKGVQPHGIRENLRGDLVMPLHDVDGHIQSAQTIRPDGDKLYLRGARKQGLHYTMGEIAPDQTVAIAEGFATAASFREATGATVVVALDTSNLAPVARSLRERYPETPLAMAADNDAHLPLRPGDRAMPNAGITKAQAIADELGLPVLAPPALPDRTAADRGTDWNDYARAHGPAAVRDLAAPILSRGAATMSETLSPPSLSPDASMVHEALQTVIADRRPDDARGAAELSAYAEQTLAEHERRVGPVVLPEQARMVIEGAAERQRAYAEQRRRHTAQFLGEDALKPPSPQHAPPERIDAMRAEIDAAKDAAAARIDAIRARTTQPPPDMREPAPVIEITRRGSNGIPPAEAPRDVPSIERDYIVREADGARFYHRRDTGELAIRADDTHIQGRLRDGQTIGAMIDIAVARGWTDIAVRGDREVARDTWLQAKTRGLDVEGYVPTRDDLHALRQAQLAERTPPLEQEQIRPPRQNLHR